MCTMEESSTPRQKLSLALLHEFRRASIALKEFSVLAPGLIGDKADIQHRLATYDSYGRFIHHLFEFYKGCAASDGSKYVNLIGCKLDRVIQPEVEKLMKHRADRIARGDGASWDNHESYYREPVPEKFAEDFRSVRNQLAHVTISRAISSSAEAVSLPTFYERYHRFALLLHEEACLLWNSQNEDSVDWEEIGRFQDVIMGKSINEDT